MPFAGGSSEDASASFVSRQNDEKIKPKEDSWRH